MVVHVIVAPLLVTLEAVVLVIEGVVPVTGGAGGSGGVEPLLMAIGWVEMMMSSYQV